MRWGTLLWLMVVLLMGPAPFSADDLAKVDGEKVAGLPELCIDGTISGPAQIQVMESQTASFSMNRLRHDT